MNMDENSTPDRLQISPVLLDHLNDEFLWLYNMFTNIFGKYKIPKYMLINPAYPENYEELF